MNGIHDLGGMHGFGAIDREAEGPVFHAAWEGRVVGIVNQVMRRRLFSVDAFRHAIERMAPIEYLRSSYYQRWQAGIERLLREADLLDPEELERRVRRLAAGGEPSPAGEPPAPIPEGQVAPGFLRPGAAPARYAIGDRVRARNANPPGHTRLPRYVRGHCGDIEHVYPCCVFPDTHAHGRGESPQPVYQVRFAAEELWGREAEAGTSVSIDLFESYLELSR